MSVTFATNSGSVENLNVSLRQGWTPCSRHTRATVACPIFRCSASSRELQWVTPYFAGGGVSVTAIRFLRSRVRGRPDRSSSNNPSTPNSSYRARQLITV